MLIFTEEGIKPEHNEKSPRGKGENQQTRSNLEASSNLTVYGFVES
jgi:hypothetical protein